jgi:hypothetical protein
MGQHMAVLTAYYYLRSVISVVGQPQERRAQQLGISTTQLLGLTLAGRITYVNIGFGLRQVTRRYTPEGVEFVRVNRIRDSPPAPISKTFNMSQHMQGLNPWALWQAAGASDGVNQGHAERKKPALRIGRLAASRRLFQRYPMVATIRVATREVSIQ